MNKKLLLSFIVVLAAAGILFAQEEKKSTVQFSTITDFAWYPKSAYISNSETHFAPITGLYSGLLGRVTLNASYKIPVLTSDNPLFSGNNITFTGNLEVTPISLMPQASISFTPIAFLNFSAGTNVGSGWNMLGMQCLAQYNSTTQSYDDIGAFSSWYLKEYANATFMFDVAALWPGEWHHIVTLATYEVDYIKLTNTTSSIWEWQTTKNCANGLQFYQSYVLGYQMPTVVSIIGVRAEFAGHYNANDYGVYADSFKGDFVTTDISPLMQLKFSDKSDMYIMFNFETRRSFAENHTKTDEEPLLICNGTEWFFNRIALSWTYKF